MQTERVSSVCQRSTQGSYSVCWDREASFHRPQLFDFHVVCRISVLPLVSLLPPRSENPAAFGVEMQPCLALIMS